MKKHDPTSDLTDFGPTSRPLLLIGHLSRSQCDKSNLKELWLDVLEEEQNLAVSLHDRHPEKFSEILRNFQILLNYRFYWRAQLNTGEG